MGLIVDTSEFVAAERAGRSAVDVIARYGSSQDYAISVVTIAELQHGVRCADSERRRRLREAFLSDVLQFFPVFALDVAVALRVGDLDANLKSRGLPLLLPDIIIAATAMHFDYSVATLNVKDFRRISGISLAVPVARP